MSTTAPPILRPPAPTTAPRRTSVRSVAVLVAILAIVAFAVLAHVALGTAAGQRADESAMRTVVADRDAQLTLLSGLGYVPIASVALVMVVCVLVALLRGRARLALGAMAIFAGANLTTQVLKHVVLERGVFVDGVTATNSFPSGHTTVVAAGIGALCLVSPPAMRSLVVVLGSFAVALTGASTVVAGWHRPSDVVGAMLVTTAWTAGVAAVVGGSRRVSGVAPFAAVVGAGGAIALLLAIGVRPSFGWVGFSDAALVLGAVTAAIAVLITLTSWASPGSFPVKHHP